MTSNPRRGAKPAAEPGCLSNRWSVLNMLGLCLNAVILYCTLALDQRIMLSAQFQPCVARESYLQRPPIHRSPAKPLQVPKEEEEEVPFFDTNVPLPQRDPHRDYHIIFSTGCTQNQHWQSYVLFHSIMESGQLGHVTRIASGCTPLQKQELQHIHTTQIEPMGKAPDEGRQESRFHLHLTPEYGFSKDQQEDGKPKVEFKYMNKPFGVGHWMEQVLGYSRDKPRTRHDDTIIILLDPDCIILRPIVNDFSTNEIWRKRTSYPKVYKITHGFPMSQEYGYNMVWFRKVTDLRNILPANELPSPVQNMTREQIVENYTSGPPYMATARDFYKIVAKWRQLAWPVQKEFPDTILAEMFAYSWAAAHLNLPHQQGHSFMVSAHFEEGFQLFKRNKNISSDKMCRGDIDPNFKPHMLHYCQQYAIGKFVIDKYRLPNDFVGHVNTTQSCQVPLLAEPPSTNISQLYDYYIDPYNHKRYPMPAATKGVFTQQEHLDRITFMMCEMISALNRAATYYKQQHCSSGIANFQKALFFHKAMEVTPEEYNNVGKLEGFWYE